MRRGTAIRRASQIHEGGWIIVPSKGEGRVSKLHATPGCSQLHITLDNGWQFTVAMGERVAFYA